MSEKRIVKEEIVYNDEGKPEKLVHEIVDGKLYLNGTEVFEWQLTEQELRAWFPQRYVQKLKLLPCPIPGCTFEATTEKGMASFRMHFANKSDTVTREKYDEKHAAWWKENKELFAGATPEEAFMILRDQEAQHAAHG